jgi:WD40 repeat protein/serine/threonine protein kinase
VSTHDSTFDAGSNRPGNLDHEFDAAFGFDLDDDSWVTLLRGLSGEPNIGRLGPYELLDEIGRGGQGVVYRARQPRTGRIIALKRVSAGADGSVSFRRRFEREIRTASALNHPSIVTIFGCDTLGGQAVLLMEYVDGLAVDRWVETVAPVGDQARTDAVVGLFERLCRAVAHAHQHGIIHRDLKPSNVLVVCEKVEAPKIDGSNQARTPVEDAIPKILDFGLARLLSPFANDTLFQTHTTGFVGTPAYASPEHFHDDDSSVDVRSDIYAVGVMLYQALTGSLPYGHRLNFSQLIQTIQDREPPRPSSIAPGIPRELELITLKAMAKEKERRYQSMDAFADDLRRFACGETVHAHPPTAGYQLRKLMRRHKLGFTLSLVILLLICGFAVIATLLGLRERAARLDSDWNAYAAGLAAADAAVRAADSASAQLHLQQTPAHLRGWEWSYFSHEADGSSSTQTLKYDVVAVNREGEFLAAQDDEKAWRLGGAQGPFCGILRPEFYLDMDISPNLASATLRTRGPDYQGIKVIALDSGRVIAEWRSDQVLAGRFSPDSRTLAIQTRRGALWLTTIDEVRSSSMPTRIAAAMSTDDSIAADISLIRGEVDFDHGTVLSFSGDSHLMACTGFDATVQIVDVLARRIVKSFSSGDRPPSVVALSPDSTRLAVGTLDKKIILLNPSTGEKYWTAEGHRELVSALTFSADGSRIASGGFDRFICIWDAATGRLVEQLCGHVGRITALSFLDGNDRLASCDDARNVKMWQLMDRDHRTAQGEFRRIDFLAVPASAAQDQWMAAAESVDDSWRNPRICLVNPRSREKAGILWRGDRGADGSQYVACAASADGRWLAVGASDGHVLLWRGESLADLIAGKADWKTGTAPWATLGVGTPQQRGMYHQSTGAVRILDAPGCWPTSLSFGAQCRLALSRFEGGLEVWDVASKTKILDRAGDTCRAIACALSPDGERLAWSDREFGLHVLNVATGEVLAETTAHDCDTQFQPRFVFSPAGNLFVPLIHDTDLIVYGSSDLHIAHRLHHTTKVFGVTFSPDGSRLISAVGDSTVCVWDVASGRRIATLHGHQYAVNCVAFSADGKTLISGGQDNTIRFWDSAPLSLPQ